MSCTILWVTVTLTSDLVFRKIVSGANLRLFKVRIWCVDATFDGRVSHTIFGSL